MITLTVQGETFIDCIEQLTAAAQECLQKSTSPHGQVIKGKDIVAYETRSTVAEPQPVTDDSTEATPVAETAPEAEPVTDDGAGKDAPALSADDLSATVSDWMAADAEVRAPLARAAIIELSTTGKLSGVPADKRAELLVKLGVTANA